MKCFNNILSTTVLWNIAVFMLVVISFEPAFRSWVIQREAGYIQAIHLPPAERVDFIFIGRSRVPAGINIETFESVVGDALRRDVKAMMLGNGGRSLITHYLGLRELFRTHPERFKDCVVLLEAPFGLPEYQRWDVPWREAGNGNWPDKRVAALIDGDDVEKIRQAEDGDIDYYKWLAYCVERESYAFYYRKLIQKRARSKIIDITDLVSEKMGLSLRSSFKMVDVELGGGETIDEDVYNAALFLAQEFVEGQTGEVSPYGSWDESVLDDLKQLVRENGGELVLFETQMAKIFEEAYATEVRLADRERLNAYAQRERIPYIEIGKRYPDEAFPDLWHLSRKLAPEYTTNIASKLLDLELDSVLGTEPGQ